MLTTARQAVSTADADRSLLAADFWILLTDTPRTKDRSGAMFLPGIAEGPIGLPKSCYRNSVTTVGTLINAEPPDRRTLER